MTVSIVLRRLVIAWGLILYLLVPAVVVAWLINVDLLMTGVSAAIVGGLSTLLHRSWRMGVWQVGTF